MRLEASAAEMRSRIVSDKRISLELTSVSVEGVEYSGETLQDVVGAVGPRRDSRRILEVPGSSSSDEDHEDQLDPPYHDPTDESDHDSEDGSSILSDLSHSPTPPPDIQIPVAPTGHRVRFVPVAQASNNDNDVLRGVVRHHNIVDFYYVEADDPTAAEDRPEDPYLGDSPPPHYIPHYTDIRTLEEIIKQNRKPPGLPTSKHPAGLTEPLVWHVILSVLRALIYLHTGQESHPRKGDSPPGWMPIVHNGIRPGNIMFTHPIAKKSKHLAFRFGRCMLGNFARCLVLPNVGEIGSEDPEDLTNDEREAIAERHDAFLTLFYAGEETGCEAPEIVSDDVAETQFPGPWSDLFSLGALAVEMMTCHNVWDLILEIEFKDKWEAKHHHCLLQERWRYVSMENRHEILRKLAGEARIVKWPPHLYPQDLRVLVEALLSHNPWNRGSTEDVLEDAEQRFEGQRPTVGRKVYEAEMIEDMWDREERRIYEETRRFLARFEEKERERRKAD